MFTTRECSENPASRKKEKKKKKTEPTISEEKSEMASFVLMLRVVTLVMSNWDYEVKNRKTPTAFSSLVTNTAWAQAMTQIHPWV